MSDYRFSANTGFLWTGLPFVERVHQAAACGFDGVELHDEAQTADAGALDAALAETGLPVLSLNVRMSDTAGCAAIPGCADAARRDIDAALETAARIGARAIHVLAGRTGEDGDRAAYMDALRHALDNGDKTILIEPISRAAMPDYFLHDINQAAEFLDEIDHPRLKIMFDCFHIEAEHGAMLTRFNNHRHRIGHIQIASYPDRAEPGTGAIDYSVILPEFRAEGYDGMFGCEYRPATTVEAGLHWRNRFRAP